MIHVVVVDDHTLVRRGIVNTLSTDKNIHVVGKAATGKEAMNIISQCKPDIVLMDMHLPDMTGLQVVRWMSQKMKDTRIIFLIGSKNILLLRQMLLPNVYGILTKDHPELMNCAVNEAFNGVRYLQPNLAYDLAIFSQKISDREFQVAYLHYEGKKASEIAKLLRLSKKTVYAHKINFNRKFEIIKKTFNCSINLLSSLPKLPTSSSLIS